MEYDGFIENILNSRGRFNCVGYKERHHIQPKCMGGENNEENLIDLYPNEHYIAHKLLCEKYPKCDGLITAWFRMCFKNGEPGVQNFISEKEYEIARIEYAKSRSEKYKEENNPFYGKHHTEESKEKFRQTLLNIKLNEPERWEKIHNKRSEAQKKVDHSIQIEAMRQANLNRDYSEAAKKIKETKHKNGSGNNRKNKVKITNGDIVKFVLASDVHSYEINGFYIVNQAQVEKYKKLLEEEK